MSQASALRRTARRVLTPNARFTLQTQVNQWRTKRPAHWLRWNAMLIDAWVRDRLNRRHYEVVDEAAARARRKSDTVFIFGSGYLLNGLSAREWEHFGAHDVFGFNAFYYQKWLPVDFHLLRGGIYGELRWRPFANEVAAALGRNPLFARAVFVMQEEFLAQFPNQLVGHRLLPAGATLLRYRTAREPGLPTRSIADGLRHQAGTLMDTVNCAYCLGWKHIVLVGVDLYDSRYFYLAADQTPGIDPKTALVVGAERNPYRGTRFDQTHATVQNGIVDIMSEWCAAMADAGVTLSVYNPRSLLRQALPLYECPSLHPVESADA